MEPQTSTTGFGQEKEGINPVTLILGAVLFWLVIVAITFVVFEFGKPFASRVEFRAADQLAAQPLELVIPRSTREIVNPVTEVTVYSNKEVTIPAHNRMELKLIGRDRGRYIYILKITNIGLGDSKVEVVFNDPSGNTSVQTLEITRGRFAMPLGFDAVVPKDDSEYILDGDGFEIAVNNRYRLMEDYIPNDLVDLNKDLGLYTLNNATLRQEPAQALKIMLDAMTAATGKYVTVASGYRSYETQVSTYAGWVKELGVTEADKVSARPGHSQHQTGAAVDFTSDEVNWQLVEAFENTAAGKWLIANAEKYGYEASFPEDGTGGGGFAYEPWHFRYIGLPD